MNKVIYVPQGNSVRLKRYTLINCPQTLYTDGFSSCNILVGFTEDENTFLLMHSDCIDLTYFDGTAERFKSQKIQSVYWIYRQGMGSTLYNLAKETFRNEAPEIQIHSYVVPNNHHGVSVSFEYQNASSFHPMIKFHEIDDIPENLIHHPKEQQLMAVVKIREIIGFRARHKYLELPSRTDCIFGEGLNPHYRWGWTNIPDAECFMDINKPETKEEMDLFQPYEPISVVCCKLRIVLDNLNTYVKQNEPNYQSDITMDNLLNSQAPQLQAYLSNYDHDSLFKLDMMDIVAHYRIKANAHEQGYFEELQKELGKNQTGIEEVVKLMERLRASPHASECKADLLSEYDNFKDIYDQRGKYSKNKKYFADLAEINKVLYQRACKEYKEEKLREATAKFKLILENSIQYLDNDSRELSTAFYNYGRRLFQLKNFDAALHILKACYSIQANQFRNNKDDKLASSKEKVASMIRECYQKSTEAS